jgi:hypothetical protein
MDIPEILDKIEGILKSESLKSDENKLETESQPNKNSANNLIYLVFHFLLNILKAPFNLFAKYLKDEIISAIKKDAKLYALIMGMMGVLFVFFSVLWLFVAVVVGVYFHEKGHSILMSIVYSIGFQIICFIFVALIAFVSSRKIKSLKMISNMKDFKSE